MSLIWLRDVAPFLSGLGISLDFHLAQGRSQILLVLKYFFTLLHGFGSQLDFYVESKLDGWFLSIFVLLKP